MKESRDFHEGLCATKDGLDFDVNKDPLLFERLRKLDFEELVGRGRDEREATTRRAHDDKLGQ